MPSSVYAVVPPDESGCVNDAHCEAAAANADHVVATCALVPVASSSLRNGPAAPPAKSASACWGSLARDPGSSALHDATPLDPEDVGVVVQPAGRLVTASRSLLRFAAGAALDAIAECVAALGVASV
jgi:hypothetical protein